MLKEILAVPGKPGLFRLVSNAANLMVVESITDKKRIPVYARDKAVSLGDTTIYLVDGDVSVGETLTKIKEKEEGKKITFDFLKTDNDTLRTYLESVLPTFDRERVYPSDIRKLLKWYDLLIAAGITEFSEKEEEKPGISDNVAADEVVETQKADVSAPPKPATPKRKDSSMMSAQVAKSPKAKLIPKSATPKKSVVGSKRGG